MRMSLKTAYLSPSIYADWLAPLCPSRCSSSFQGRRIHLKSRSHGSLRTGGQITRIESLCIGEATIQRHCHGVSTNLSSADSASSNYTEHTTVAEHTAANAKYSRRYSDDSVRDDLNEFLRNGGHESQWSAVDVYNLPRCGGHRHPFWARVEPPTIDDREPLAAEFWGAIYRISQSDDGVTAQCQRSRMVDDSVRIRKLIYFASWGVVQVSSFGRWSFMTLAFYSHHSFYQVTEQHNFHVNNL